MVYVTERIKGKGEVLVYINPTTKLQAYGVSMRCYTRNKNQRRREKKKIRKGVNECMYVHINVRTSSERFWVMTNDKKYKE
jgi:hypothetical protein